ncbi:hypothetical protein [Clostridium sp. FS41]|uniref:hypothetical protein n=1 Tax=Clostridia TaxID=186801 RepID=UPI0005D2F351|nr:hypothetical protein [Clostridium sp. FS41]KJJ76537.1 hypothetical protein CLFS41_04710 [Clostridium sp. FS41]
MLDKRDLEMIRIIMKEEISASEERMDVRIDTRFAEQEKRIDARFTEQEKRIDARFAEQEKRIDARFAEQEKQFNNRIEELSLDWDIRLDLRFAASENLILGELDRVHMNLQSQLDDMRSRLDELTEYYRIKKLDNVNQTLLLQMIQEVERRVEALEKKSA